MNLGISGKNVLVVGASKGIGKAIAIAFASEQARITTIARSEDLLIDLNTKLHEIYNDDHKYIAADLMEHNNDDLMNSLLSERGVFDIVIQNIGGSLVSRNALGTYEEWEHAWKFNAGLAIELNHILIPPMVKKGWGRVVHISSISAKMLRGNPLYASSKAFLNAYVTSVGRQLAPSGVVMSAVMPGAIAFPDSYWDMRQKDLLQPAGGGKSGAEICKDFLWHHQAANRFGTPKEVADVVLFMSSNQASFMQSALIPVDGANM